MSIRDEVYKLEKELNFWEYVHRNEYPGEIEFKLEDKIRQLKNCDEFGTPRYNGSYEDEDEDEEEYVLDNYPRMVKCKYCGKDCLNWIKINGKYRLGDKNGIHMCEQYKK